MTTNRNEWPKSGQDDELEKDTCNHCVCTCERHSSVAFRPDPHQTNPVSVYVESEWLAHIDTMYSIQVMLASERVLLKFEQVLKAIKSERLLFATNTSTTLTKILHQSSIYLN